MCVTEAKLTVFFEDPFWVGVLERRQGDRLEAARLVFGAEPKDSDVYRVILQEYDRLRFSLPVADERPPRDLCGMNPKRRQREASQALTKTGIGTKAQQALQQQREAGKAKRTSLGRQAREAEKERQFELKQAKRRQKHLGH